MPSITPSCSVRGRVLACFAVAACLAGFASSNPPARAHAEVLKPWTPPGADSLLILAAQSKQGFRRAAGDSVGGGNFAAYELVGRMARRLLGSLGRANVAQAGAVEPVLDSLGLDTDVVIDPQSPNFVLVMVRNPFRLTADAVGFLYWYRGADLRMQGLMFRGSRNPRMRVWWTGQREAPYEWGILDETRGTPPRFGLGLLRLSAEGYFWNLIQYENNGPDLGTPGEAVWADLNRDGVPEVVSWNEVEADSMFALCSGCPKLIEERIFTDRPEGFVPHDSRVLPSPFASFTLFIKLLQDRNRIAAMKLLVHPEKIDEAIALGWGTRRGRGTWTIEYGEPDVPWPQWLAIRFRGAAGDKRLIFHFTLKDGRWVIRDWIPVVSNDPPAPHEGIRVVPSRPGGER